jgi:hypothetical protein
MWRNFQISRAAEASIRRPRHSSSWRRVAIIAAAVLGVVIMRPSTTIAQQADPWIVAELSGEAAQQAADGTWRPIAQGSSLAAGAPVRTGADGRIVLQRHEDRLTVAPQSEFEIPVDVDPATGPSILQRLGTLLFSIDHTPGRRFEVKTPYLAAVVKGTVFTVTAGDSSNAVHVAKGAVEVAAAVSHEIVLVRPGQTAIVSAAGRLSSLLAPTGDPRHGTEHAAVSVTPASTTEAANGSPRITRMLGEAHPDISALSHGLLGDAAPMWRGGNAAHAAAPSGGADGRIDTSTVSADEVAAAGGSASGANPNAAGGNPNAGGANANAGGNGNTAGGNPNAAGGNPNAAGGNPNAAGGNPNAAGGNLNAAVNSVNNAVAKAKGKLKS